MRMQLLAARLALAALVCGLAPALAAVIAVRLGLMPYASGLALMVPATLFGLLALALALAWLALALRRNDGTGRRTGLAALLLSLGLVYPPLATLWAAHTAPPIHDASTDPDDPPHFVVLARMRAPGMNPPAFDGTRRIHFRGKDETIAYVLHEYYPDITKPRRKLMPGNPHPVQTQFWRCFEIAKSLGWHIVDYSAKDGRIEATASSFWFGRISDIVIRVRAAGTGARPDARAQSREGPTDNGFNLELLKDFAAKVGG